MSENGDGHAEQRRQHLGAEKGPVTLVSGVGHKGDASRDQLWTCRLDLDRRTITVAAGKAQAVIEAGVLLVD